MAKSKKVSAGSVNNSPKKSLKIPVIITSVTALLFFLSFFIYRFIFPEDTLSSDEDPGIGLSAEEQLANAIAMDDASRRETVRDYPITVFAGDTELSALYSGILYDGTPYGSGTYKFSGPDWDWTFSGTLTNGCISSGKVTDYPYVFELEDDNSYSKYTGTLVGGLPKGNGSFEITTGDDLITLQGYYNPDKQFSGSVENYPLTFGYNGLVFDGRYTGELISGSPDGEGSFSCEGDYYYIYSGVWNSGSPVGPGTLSTNCASFSSGDGTSFIAVYKGGIENSQFSGEGEMTIGDETTGGYFYSGGWKDGMFSGTGKLVCYDPSGMSYTYEGGFLQGAYDGNGSLIFDDDNIIKYIGNFKQGNFRPSVSELLSALYSSGSSSPELTEQVRVYLDSHQESLLSHDTSILFFGSGFSYENYAQTASNSDDRCFMTSITLLQKNEYDPSAFGFPVTEILGYSNGGRYVYYGYYFDSLPDAESGSIIRITAYPIGFSSYSDASGKDVLALRFAAFEVEKLN